jgi:hypothetical protein
VFQDLDATLVAVLHDATSPADLRGADVSFDTPGKDFAPAQATVNLFLQEVVENRELRDTAPVLGRAGNGFDSRRPPLRVDCTYLVTTWSARSGGMKSEEEHRLLGLALLWLSRFPLIGAPFLAGSLKSPPQPFPLPAFVAQSREGRSLGEFWSALGIAPRPAFSLTVTIALPVFGEVDHFSEVKRIQVQAGLLDAPLFRGRVLDAAGASAPGAQVTVVEAGRQTVSDAAGAFAVPGLDFGSYTLTVRLAPHPDVSVPVVYGADSQVHNVTLPDP